MQVKSATGRDFLLMVVLLLCVAVGMSNVVNVVVSQNESAATTVQLSRYINPFVEHDHAQVYNNSAALLRWLGSTMQLIKYAGVAASRVSIKPLSNETTDLDPLQIMSNRTYKPP
jgi:hypothetical protein